MYQDPRRILGVAPCADVTEIRQAYRRLVKQYHPDVGGDPQRFKEINAAYMRLVSNQESPMLATPTSSEHRVRVVYGNNKPYKPSYLALRKILRPKIIWRRGRVALAIPLVIAVGIPAATVSFYPTATIICSAGFLALGQVKLSKF